MVDDVDTCYRTLHVHRGKIEAVINNAQRAVELVKKEARWPPTFGDSSEAENSATAATVSTSAESVALSKALKRRLEIRQKPTTVQLPCRRWGYHDHAEGVLCVSKR